MSFPRFDEYKASRIEWLGEVPAHWQIGRIKHSVRSISQGWSPQCDGYPAEAPEEIGVLKVGCVNGGRFNPRENKALPAELGSRPELGLATGDVLISRANTRELVGSAAVVDQDFPNLLLCDKLYRLRLNEKVLVPKFLVYFLGAENVRGQIELAASGASSSMLNIGQSVILDMSVAIPPLDEEHLIVDFLDRETAKMDDLVAEQRNLIALLKEKRQALISHVVTKGLDQDVPMKDSGVAWLGEVPGHWGVTRLKYSTSDIIDCPHETPVYSPDGEYLVVRTADVMAGTLDLSNGYRLDEAEYEKRTRRGKLLPDDIVYSREGERWGNAAIVPDGQPLCLGQRMMQFRARKGISPAFLMWQLNADTTYRQGQIDTVGATSPHVNVCTISNYVLTEPPLEEQHDIARFLDASIAHVDALVAEAESTIDLLLERRTALISAAVTGKIDVRNITTPVEEAIA